MDLCLTCANRHCHSCSCGCHTSVREEANTRKLIDGTEEIFLGDRWSPIKTNKGKEYPLNSDFFMIGNTHWCPPCKKAEAVIEKLVKVNGWTYEKWTVEKGEIFTSGTKCSAEFKADFARKAIKVTNHTSIPRIWYKGDFIGGYNELMKLIDTWSTKYVGM